MAGGGGRSWIGGGSRGRGRRRGRRRVRKIRVAAGKGELEGVAGKGRRSRFQPFVGRSLPPSQIPATATITLEQLLATC